MLYSIWETLNVWAQTVRTAIPAWRSKGQTTSLLYARALLAPGASSLGRGLSPARWLRTSDPSLLGLQPRVRSATAHAPQPLAGWHNTGVKLQPSINIWIYELNREGGKKKNLEPPPKRSTSRNFSPGVKLFDWLFARACPRPPLAELTRDRREEGAGRGAGGDTLARAAF